MSSIDHIAFIMDGNSTWAKRNKKSLMNGYLHGMQTMVNTILNSIELNIKYVTFYAFSSENWGRPQKWVTDFMNLAMYFFQNDKSIDNILNAGAKLKVIGDKSKLEIKFQQILEEYEEKTINNNKIIVQLAISYGSRNEIVRAINRMIKLGIEINEQNLSNNLDTAYIPDPQLIIRTSGKQRLSNFLLWQSSYSEFYFTNVLWPDFNMLELEQAIYTFSTRKRTYGK